MYLIFKTLNATGEYLLKTQVEDSPDVIESDYTEIASNIEKLEGDVRASFKYFAKEGDKEWWRSFFENYDEIGVYLLSTYSQTVTCIFRQSHKSGSLKKSSTPKQVLFFSLCVFVCE